MEMKSGSDSDSDSDSGSSIPNTFQLVAFPCCWASVLVLHELATIPHVFGPNYPVAK
jgi:hypothetical protein